MKPLLINTYDRGGAAKACLRLHKGLLQEGVASEVLIGNKTNSNIPNTHKISLNSLERSLDKKISYRLKRILKEFNLYSEKSDKFIASRAKGLEVFNYPYSDYRIYKEQVYQNADIVNLHWVTGLLDYKSFFANNNKPVAWTLHDQNPFTGGEHYTETILGIDKSGFPIERNLSKSEKQKFKEILDYKQRAISSVDNLTIVSPSKWLADSAKNSKLFSRFKVVQIPYGLERNIFKPRDYKFARELLDLPYNKKIILFVSDAVHNSRKGFIYLQRAFEKLKNKDVVLLSVGASNSELKQFSNYRNLGFVHDELLMSVIYSAADVFVIPSLMDNLPNTVLESIMCGTPVIGFPIGGIPDMVQEGENGYLTEEISVPALVKTIERFIETSDVFDREQIRKNAVRKYDLSVQANAYIKLYNDILKFS